MINYLNRRSFARFDYEVPVKIHTGIHKGKGFFEDDSPSIPATLSNYSRGGVYLESVYFVPPGTPITITLSSPDTDPVTGGKKSYHTEVKWCRKIAGGSQTMYGIGAMYDQRVTDFVFGFGTVCSSRMMFDHRMADALMI